MGGSRYLDAAMIETVMASAISTRPCEPFTYNTLADFYAAWWPAQTSVAGRRLTKRMEEPTMATSFEQAGTRSYRVKVEAWWTLISRHRRLIVLLIILPTLALVAAGSWLIWTVTYPALGRQAASLAVVTLVATTFAISREFARRP
jgi:hypothetical protein